MRIINLDDLTLISLLWKPSDWILLLLSSALSIEFLIILLILSKTRFEQRLSMQHLSRLLKLCLFYMLCLLPLLTCLILFSLTYRDIQPFTRTIGSYTAAIGNASLSTQSSWGNHWLFLLLLALWAVSILGPGLHHLNRDHHLLKQIEHTSHPADIQLTIITQQLCRELGLTHSVTLRQNSMLTVPFVIGVFHPRLYFPTSITDEAAIRLLLRHELVHCRRRDCLFRRMASVLCSLYWFLPQIKHFTEYFIEINEMACDEMALEHASAQERYDYAALLLKLASVPSLTSCAVSWISSSENEILRRLQHIAKRHTYRRFPLILCLCISLICCPLTTLASACTVSEGQVIFLDSAQSMQSAYQRIMSYSITKGPTFRVAYDDVYRTAMQIVTSCSPEPVSAKETNNLILLDSRYLSAGTILRFVIEEDSADIQYRAGFQDAKGNRAYVNAVGGRIDHNFTVAYSGDYTLFVEYLN